MVRVAKLHDFVSFNIFQVPERSFFKKENQFLKNQKKNYLAVSTSKGPPLDKNRKKSKIFSFLKKNHTFVPEYELEMFSAFF